MAISKGFFSVFRSARVGWLTPIGLASGLPYMLSRGSLQTWMTVEGVSITTVGLFAWVGAPYSLKFLWAPFLDRYQLPWAGRRRGWMLLCQALMMMFIVGLGLTGGRAGSLTVAALALALAFCSASFDIVADAHRTDLLPENERAAGTATFVTGYRVALFLTNGLALMLATRLTWRVLYFGFAVLVGATMWATWKAPEPITVRTPQTLGEAVVEPLVDFFTRKGAWLAAVFVILFRVGDSIAATMVTPFLLKTVGFTQTEVGSLNKVFGSVATIVGAVLGGAVVARAGLRKPLVLFGALAAITNVLYAALAYTGKSYAMLAVAVAIDNMAGGMSSAAFVAFLMSLCTTRYSATQYALLTSLSTLGGLLLAGFSGYLATAVGWGAFFLITASFIVPALLVLAVLPKSTEAAHEPVA
ncbi:MAG: MFS transporter [Deltaproteobacteria bacterium]|nr:MFS transporter [Deltaproteobacteria bacterium]